MLRSNEKSYLLSIPGDKIASIKPFDLAAIQAAQQIINEIKVRLPDLEIFFGGATALEIAGQNDIDLNLLSIPGEYNMHFPVLVELFGQPAKSSPTLIKWEFVRNGFEVELYLTDRNSPELQRQIQVYNLLLHNTDYKKEYEQIKLACNGMSFREYMKRKYEFFNKILAL